MVSFRMLVDRRQLLATTMAGAFGAITGGVGHNPPQEAPRAFCSAIIDVHDLMKG